jgi:general secretion pathway protein N
MMDMLQRRPLIAILAGVAAMLLLAIGIETGFGTRLRHAPPAEPSKPGVAPDAKLLPPLAMVSPDQAYPETTARPLFVPTRRPAPVEAVGKSSFERGQYVLQGVIVVGDQRTALIKEKASGRIHRVDKGKDMNGVVVETVEPTKVTIAMGGERETLNLSVQKAAGAPGAAAPAVSVEHGGPFATSAAQPAAAPVTNVVAPPFGAPPVTVPPASSRVPAANPNPVPSPAAAGQPMTPEELLARRRARRNQPTQ